MGQQIIFFYNKCVRVLSIHDHVMTNDGKSKHWVYFEFDWLKTNNKTKKLCRLCKEMIFLLAATTAVWTWIGIPSTVRGRWNLKRAGCPVNARPVTSNVTSHGDGSQFGAILILDDNSRCFSTSRNKIRFRITLRNSSIPSIGGHFIDFSVNMIFAQLCSIAT